MERLKIAVSTFLAYYAVTVFFRIVGQEIQLQKQVLEVEKKAREIRAKEQALASVVTATAVAELKEKESFVEGTAKAA